jgi:hypothetical protein
MMRNRRRIMFLLYYLNFILYRKISIDRPGGIHIFSTHNFCTIHKRTKKKAYYDRKESTLSEDAFHLCSLTYGTEVMCRKNVDTPWSIYRVFRYLLFYY